MRVRILDAQKVIYEGDFKEVLLPGEDGELSVLDFHQPFLYRLRKGYIQLQPHRHFLIKDGVAKMQNNQLIIMVE